MEFTDRIVRLDEAAAIIGIPAVTLRNAHKQGRLLLDLVRVAPRIAGVRMSQLNDVLAGKQAAIGMGKAAAEALAAAPERK